MGTAYIMDASFREINRHMPEDSAFVERGESATPRSKKLTLPLSEDGSIDWDNALEKHKAAFIDAIKADPNGILQNIQEEASTPHESSSSIADATVVATVNILFATEGVLFSTLGTKVAPVLKNLHPVVAIKACTVSQEELKPIMGECKEILEELLPPEIMPYQKWAVVGEHLIKLSAAKFKACVDLAIEIERQKQTGAKTAHGPNGGVVIDAQ